MEKKIIVRKFTSKKSGKPVVALVADIGYTQKFLTFDTACISELLEVPIVDLVSRGDFETTLCSFE